jgi:Matrixin
MSTVKSLVRRAANTRITQSVVVAATVALGACLVTYAKDSLAFCRSMTEKDKLGESKNNGLPFLGRDGEPAYCPGKGVPLFWRSRCIGYSLNRAAAKTVSLATASRIVSDAFSQWTRAACLTDDAANSRVSIDARDLGPVDCNVKGYNLTGPNQSVIMFRDDKWVQPDDSNPKLEGSNTIALTSVYYDKRTGEIFDADMEINSIDHTFTTDSTFQNGTKFDLASVVTHEVGHFLGLNHSPEQSSTMYYNYDTLETKKQFLKNDDVQGICSIYRPDGTRATGVEGKTPLVAGPCDPTPKRGLSSTCPVDSCSVHGANVATAGSACAAWVLTLVLGAGVLRRRSRGQAT